MILSYLASIAVGSSEPTVYERAYAGDRGRPADRRVLAGRLGLGRGLAGHERRNDVGVDTSRPTVFFVSGSPCPLPVRHVPLRPRDVRVPAPAWNLADQVTHQRLRWLLRRRPAAAATAARSGLVHDVSAGRQYNFELATVAQRLVRP